MMRAEYDLGQRQQGRDAAADQEEEQFARTLPFVATGGGPTSSSDSPAATKGSPQPQYRLGMHRIAYEAMQQVHVASHHL